MDLHGEDGGWYEPIRGDGGACFTRTLECEAWMSFKTAQDAFKSLPGGLDDDASRLPAREHGQRMRMCSSIDISR